MSIVLYHHPWSRAANVVWMLEEVGVPYELRWVDIRTGEQKRDPVITLNPMGKLPVLTDGDAVVTEAAAVGLYLADRYAAGRLAPALDDPARGAYLRWSLFPAAVIEPGVLSQQSKWEFNPVAAGWGTYDSMIAAIESALSHSDWLLGDRFSMADCILGGTLRFMLMFKTLEARPAFTAYVERCNARPAAQRAQQRNIDVMKAHGLG